jgi:hypothetical protein
MEMNRQAGEALYAKQVLRAAERAMERAAMTIHDDLKRGLNPMATITSIAPFTGILGTVWALAFDTFVGFNGDKPTGLAVVAEGLSRACLPAAFGLFVALQSLWCYKYLRGRLAGFDLEMADTSLSLVNQLRLQFGHHLPARATGGVTDSLRYLEAYAPDLPADQRSRRRSTFATVALLLVAWWVQALRYFEYGFLPLNSAITASLRAVAMMICLSYLPAYAVWVGLFHRKSFRVPLIAAALCLSWWAAGLFFDLIR